MYKIDISKPIIPGKSIGGIQLSTHISQYQELLASFSWLDKTTLEDKSVSLFSSFHIGYELRDTLILIFDVLTGKLQRICALEKYVGELSNGIRIGMSLEEALSKESGIWYDENEELYFIRGLEGVSFETDLRRQTIQVITIYTLEKV